MGQKIIKSIKDLLSNSNQIVTTVSVEKFKAIQKKRLCFVDLRIMKDIKEGKIPVAFFCPGEW